MNTARLFLILFSVISVVHVSGQLLNSEMISNISKPFILVSLLFYYLFYSKTTSYLYLWALICSSLGDVLLISDTEINFMLGLVSFLIAHVLFIILVSKRLGSSKVNLKLFSFLPFLILCFGLLYMLKESLGGLFIPVAIYAVTISLFGTVSFLNFLISNSKSSMFLLVGALLFVISDSVLAINKFYMEWEFFPTIVMITYILAQYFICEYVIINSRETNIGIKNVVKLPFREI